MTTTADNDDAAYIHSVLGQQPIAEYMYSSESQVATDNDAETLSKLLHADSLWQTGNAEKAQAVLKEIDQSYLNSHVASFKQGLELLVQGEDLLAAYTAFYRAAEHWQSNNNDSKSESESDLIKVFLTERAVNIAFWLACTGKMVQAGQLVQEQTDKTPFAGGILSFALHMQGDSTEAERMARSAIAKGYKDPWTLHAVAHCLYSLGRSRECIAWLLEHRTASENCSAFMKGHMEFHLALCFLDHQEENHQDALTELIREGPLWRSMTNDMKQDYWNAAGLLNVLWKAELRGFHTTVEACQQPRQEALDIILGMTKPTPYTKSMVFSLCILRWMPKTAGSDARAEWIQAISQSENPVFRDVAKTVEMLYPNNNNEMKPTSDPNHWKQAAQLLLPHSDSLDKLGASPEQREIIEEFVAVVMAKQGIRNDQADVSSFWTSWKQRNLRPKIPFYEKLLEGRQ